MNGGMERAFFGQSYFRHDSEKEMSVKKRKMPSVSRCVSGKGGGAVYGRNLQAKVPVYFRRTEEPDRSY